MRVSSLTLATVIHLTIHLIVGGDASRVTTTNDLRKENSDARRVTTTHNFC